MAAARGELSAGQQLFRMFTSGRAYVGRGEVVRTTMRTNVVA
jgi:hypothetical protein